eukprot:scaffold261_cov336-Pavlova_lutheri.AAC.69
MESHEGQLLRHNRTTCCVCVHFSWLSSSSSSSLANELFWPRAPPTTKQPTPLLNVAMADERVARHHARLEAEALFRMGQEAAERAERREARQGPVENDALDVSVSTNAAIEQDRRDVRQVRMDTMPIAGRLQCMNEVGTTLVWFCVEGAAMEERHLRKRIRH